ncbi:MAG: prepilin-type N-terminal cleavage/methylation domain-containing protein [Phycisphaerae bacterium]|nr:prepilin-type N-terminal cleavage/methylation domain-containing protein [Phycisphaerae bacterium]
MRTLCDFYAKSRFAKGGAPFKMRETGFKNTFDPGVKHRRAFTLVEILLASVLGAMVAAAGVAAYRSVNHARGDLAFSSEVMAHGRYGLSMMRDDLASQFRPRVPGEMKLVGITSNTEEKALDRLVIYVTADPMGPGDDLQGDIYEVEYGLSLNEETRELYLGRRIAPVEDLALGNKRGKLVRVARHIDQLMFEFYDEVRGKWQRGRNAADPMPQAVRISLWLQDRRAGERPSVKMSQEVWFMKDPRGVKKEPPREEG